MVQFIDLDYQKSKYLDILGQLGIYITQEGMVKALESGGASVLVKM